MLDEARRLRTAELVDVGDRDRGAVAGEEERRRASLAGGRAGDERDLSREHGIFGHDERP